MNDEGDGSDGDGVGIGEQDVFAGGDGPIAELGAVGAAEVPDEQSFAVESELAMLSTDIYEWNPESAVFPTADDDIAAQAKASNSGLVVDDFEPDVHIVCRGSREGRAVHGM